MYPILNLSILAAFMALCLYCLEEPKSYDTAGVDRLLAEYHPLTLKQRQANALQEVYNIESDEQASGIWGK